MTRTAPFLLLVAIASSLVGATHLPQQQQQQALQPQQPASRPSLRFSSLAEQALADAVATGTFRATDSANAVAKRSLTAIAQTMIATTLTGLLPIPLEQGSLVNLRIVELNIVSLTGLTQNAFFLSFDGNEFEMRFTGVSASIQLKYRHSLGADRLNVNLPNIHYDMKVQVNPQSLKLTYTSSKFSIGTIAVDRAHATWRPVKASIAKSIESTLNKPKFAADLNKKLREQFSEAAEIVEFVRGLLEPHLQGHKDQSVLARLHVALTNMDIPNPLTYNIGEGMRTGGIAAITLDSLKVSHTNFGPGLLRLKLDKGQVTVAIEGLDLDLRGSGVAAKVGFTFTGSLNAVTIKAKMAWDATTMVVQAGPVTLTSARNPAIQGSLAAQSLVGAVVIKPLDVIFRNALATQTVVDGLLAKVQAEMNTAFRAKAIAPLNAALAQL